MNDYIILMHSDAPPASGEAWASYFQMLKESGRFGGGSAIGTGVCVTKAGDAGRAVTPLSGYIRVEAESIDDARRLLQGNPVLEQGGTVEIRLLPRD